MCGTCGCSDADSVTMTDMNKGDVVSLSDHVHDHEHDHDHGHSHGHDHAHDHGHGHSHAQSPRQSATIKLEQQILAKNNTLAERNRGWLDGRNILALNLVSSPGAGKTTLLERTIRDLNGELPVSVVEGDQQTLNDATRIRATGCPVVQINTGKACHLEADMLARALKQLDPPTGSLVMVENVGNLVCPAMFDLGERAKVVIASITEGEDKPLKYPHMFRASDLLLLNKVDLLPHVPFDVERFCSYARQVNPKVRIMQVSASRGDGMEEWYAWLKEQVQN